MTKQVAVVDLTIKAKDLSVETLTAVFRKLCKKFVFQLERGEKKTENNPDGYLHYQCRVSMFKKTTVSSILALFLGEDIDGVKVSPSSNTSIKGEAFYCMKEQTRESGPWSDKDVSMPILRTVSKMEEAGLRPWQSDLLLQLEGYDDRHIHVVIDPGGNIGKSSLMKWIYIKRIGQPIPPMCTMEDLVQFCMNFPNKGLYVIDMPRAMPKKKLFGMYAGIETIKNGILYDKRYQGKYMMMDEPNVLVFTNCPPKKKYLSADRWKLWTVKDNELEVFKYHDFSPPVNVQGASEDI